MNRGLTATQRELNSLRNTLHIRSVAGGWELYDLKHSGKSLGIYQTWEEADQAWSKEQK